MPHQNISMLGKPAIRSRVVPLKILSRSQNIFSKFYFELCPEILLMPGISSAATHTRSVQYHH